MAFQLLYPEKRLVSDDVIVTWYSDAVANGYIRPRNEFVHDAGDVVGMAHALMNAGQITLGRMPTD